MLLLLRFGLLEQWLLCAAVLWCTKSADIGPVVIRKLLIVVCASRFIVLHCVCVFDKLKVLPKDLQLCTDMATGVDSLGQFSFGDLVQLEWVLWYLDLSAILHHMDASYGHVVQHHQWTSSQQFCHLLYNKFATSQCQSPTSRHAKMLGCGKFFSVGGEFVVQQVVELLWAHLLVYMSIATSQQDVQQI